MKLGYKCLICAFFPCADSTLVQIQKQQYKKSKIGHLHYICTSVMALELPDLGSALFASHMAL